jgi:hypothetical protein
MAKSALVLIADNTEDIEVTTVVDILRRGGVMVTLLKVHMIWLVQHYLPMTFSILSRFLRIL